MEELEPTIEIVHNDIEQSLLKDSNHFYNFNKDGDPPLHAAVRDGNFKIVQYLVSRGRDLGRDGLLGYKEFQVIDLNVKNKQREAALDLAQKLSLTNNKLHGEMDKILNILQRARALSVKQIAPPKVHSHLLKNAPAFIWSAFSKPRNRKQSTKQENIGANKFLSAYRDSDFKKMERALLKYDLRLENTETEKDLRFRASISKELNNYAALDEHSRMDLALAKTQENYNPDFDTDTLVYEFFKTGYDDGDYALMSDMIAEYGYQFDNSDLELASDLAYSAIEEGYGDMAENLIEQCNIPMDYLAKDKDLTLGEKLASFKKNRSSRLKSIKYSKAKSHTDLIDQKRAEDSEEDISH